MKTFILVVTTAGVGADLCTLPLLLTALMGQFGLVTLRAEVAWLGAWPAIVVFAAVVAMEIVLDSVANRRHKALRRVWPGIQHVASAVVTVVVVLAMGGALAPLEQLAAIVGGWCCTGVVRGGLVEKLKLVIDVTGGA